ncbi:MAG: 1-deoxy-D-xylulose-5-phosphate reductoisomerase [Lachnospiraceae bacterium]|nr:1-deoxy-D-xylulose-5-phosphate reductoisomerase [Candidatus Colinaster equi]
MKKITILGSTGSIGTQTLEVVREYSDDLKVIALAANSQVDLMEAQIREFKPKYVCMCDENAAKELKAHVADTDTVILSGMDGLMEISSLDEIDTVVTAIVGMIGIRPTIAAIEAGKNIALANKETLVTAGHIIMPLARKKNVSILPVDSEHSAIFQSLQGQPNNRIDKILLTASGGPFRGKKREELADMTVADALNHPNWSMGRKITIDSATLCNKGLEVIEAKWLFNVELDMIHVLLQPQSIIHSGVQFVDGAVVAQLGVPDMKLPIQYALFYPDRRPMRDNRIDFAALAQITFEEPDYETFKGLNLAKKASTVGGTMPTVFNAANEKAVALFLAEKIKFLEIYDIIEECMGAHKAIDNPTVDEILDAEAECYEYIAKRT